MSELVVEGLAKRYGTVRALENVSARFRSGEIHAVLGENGAGKSTLVGVLAGFVTPDSGTVTLDGKPMALGHAHHCRHAGVAMVHQHFTLVPEFTVRENLALDRMESLLGVLHPDALAAPALEQGKGLGWPIDPDARVRNLPVGVQQRLEILKVLADDSPVAILDEPTAVLAPDEVLDLFRVLRDLRKQGKIVILIAHKLSEVLAIADRVTVLRKGQFVATAVIGDVDEIQLATWMVGELPADLAKAPRTDTTPGLRLEAIWVKGDRGEDALRGLSLEARRGEILGIGGVDGNGQVELAEVVVGVRQITSGQIAWADAPFADLRTAYIPQDRQSHGLAVGMSITDNLLIEGHRRKELSKGLFLDYRRIQEWTADLIQRFQIKTPSPNLLVGSLSGGNQQKVVVSRNLDQTPELLVCVNPTRGLDIQAAGFVQRQILKARDEGAAVLLISTDLDELAALADRTLFISRGRLADALKAASLVGGS